MNLIQYIVIHCLATPKGRWVTKSDLSKWHMGPKDLPGGKVRYLGKDYINRDALPDDQLGGVLVRNLHGRGWDRLGYADMIHNNGLIENITPYDQDDFIDKKEITWGAVGINSVSRHISLEGGIHPSGKTSGIWKFEELYSDEQFVSLAGYLNQAVLNYPWIKIIGHKDVPKAGKTCPNCDVMQFCKSIGIKEENIGLIKK